MNPVSPSDAMRPISPIRSLPSDELATAPIQGRLDNSQYSLSTAPTYEESFNHFVAQFAAEVFVTPDRPFAYIAKKSILEASATRESEYLEHNNFWANLDDKLAYQMCRSGGSSHYNKRDDGSYAISQSLSFVGNVKMQREGDEVSFSDPWGHNVKLLQMPKQAAHTLLHQLHYVPLPRVQQVAFLHQFPDERFLAVTSTSYGSDYSAFLGNVDNMVFHRVVGRSVYRDGGTTILTIDAGEFYYPSQWQYPGRSATFRFDGTDDTLTLKSFDRDQEVAIARQLGVINDESALPLVPDLSQLVQC